MAGRKRSEMMEETRAKLVASARKAFAEKGFAAASMDDLTAEAGLTRGALYHNFGDKRGLLQAVVRIGFPPAHNFRFYGMSVTVIVLTLL